MGIEQEGYFVPRLIVAVVWYQKALPAMRGRKGLPYEGSISVGCDGAVPNRDARLWGETYCHIHK